MNTDPMTMREANVGNDQGAKPQEMRENGITQRIDQLDREIAGCQRGLKRLLAAIAPLLMPAHPKGSGPEIKGKDTSFSGINQQLVGMAQAVNDLNANITEIIERVDL